MPPKSKADRKTAYHRKLYQLLDEYTQVLVAVADHVRSNQLHNIRKGLRGHAVVLMGKNSMMKRTIKIYFENSGNKAILNLLPLLVGNVGLIFVKGDLKEVSENVAKYKVGAPARVGSVAPIDVVVPSGNTGLDPSHTSFFQVLNIPTKINKGTVEILTPVNLIKKGDKVGSSEAALLSKLGIMPFSYGLVLISIYDNGSVFGPEVLKLTEDDLLGKFAMGVSMVTSLSLAVSYPSLAAAPHMFINGYKNVLAVAIEIDYSFPLADKFKEYLAYPSKFVGAHFGVAAHFGDGADHFGAPDATAEFAYPFPYPVRTTPSFSQPIRDWLSHPLFPMGIKWITFNQGSCSCCWITVASALVSWQFVLESGTWTYMIASPQDLIDTFERCQMYGQSPPIGGQDERGCRRGDSILALNFIKEHGVNLVGNYAFVGHLQRHTVIPKNLTRMWIDTVVDLRNCSLDVLEAELLHHPIAGTINATRSFIEHVGEGIYRGDPVDDHMYNNPHIVLVLALRRCNAELYFEIQNSHGLGWGVNGFGKVLFPLIKPHASCRGASTSIHQVQDMDI